MLHTIKQWKDDMALEVYLLRMAYGASDCSEDGWYTGRDIGKAHAYALVLWFTLYHWLLALRCKRHGHDWEDQSMDVAYWDGEFCMECTRCGAQQHGWWTST